MTQACALCSLGADLEARGRLHRLAGGAWTLNDNVEASGRPRLVLQVAEHREDVDELTPYEAQALGALLPRLIKAFKKHAAAEKIYVHLLNEAGHVHLHLVPRYRSDPEGGRGLALSAARTGPDGHLHLSQVVARDVVREGGVEPSHLVGGVVRALTLLQRSGPYELIRRRSSSAKGAGSRFAELYVPAWIVVWVLCLAAADAQWLAVPFALLLAWRWMDMVTLHQLTLLDRSRQRLASSTRSLLLLALNVVELSIGTSLALRLLDVPLATALRDGVRAVTLNGWPETARPAVEALLATTTVTALLLLTVALSTVVGLISQNYREGA